MPIERDTISLDESHSQALPETQHKKGNAQDEADHLQNSDHTKWRSLTTDKHVSFSRGVVVDFLLCDHTVDMVGHIDEDEGCDIMTAFLHSLR